MTSKRFLNVKYENQPTQIDTKDMEGFVQVQKEVLAAFEEITVGFSKVQLWNKNGDVSQFTELDDLDDIKALPEEYFAEEDGLFLTVQLPPAISTELQKGKLFLKVFCLFKKSMLINNYRKETSCCV